MRRCRSKLGNGATSRARRKKREKRAQGVDILGRAGAAVPPFLQHWLNGVHVGERGRDGEVDMFVIPPELRIGISSGFAPAGDEFGDPDVLFCWIARGKFHLDRYGSLLLDTSRIHRDEHSKRHETSRLPP